MSRLASEIEGFVRECLELPLLNKLPKPQQAEVAAHIRSYFYQVALETLTEKIDEGKLNEIEEKLRLDTEYIKQNSQLPG